jgi:hypothetical protein
MNTTPMPSESKPFKGGNNNINNIIDNNLQVNNKNQSDYIDKIIELQVYFKQGRFSESIATI